MNKEKYTYNDLMLIKHYCWIQSFIRTIWLEFLEPSKNVHEFYTKALSGERKLFYKKTGLSIDLKIIRKRNNSEDEWYLGDGVYFIGNVDKGHEDWFNEIHKLKSVHEYIKFSLEELIHKNDLESILYRKEVELLEQKVNRLTPELIESLKFISFEYMTWLKKHPKAINRISWEALEKITAEIFASKGFYVALTGKQKGKSADIIAVQEDNLGIETRYLIECKKYNKSRNIGLEIINGVLGAKIREGAEHAILVTTSTFSNHVLANTAKFKSLNINLRDGNDLINWISEYKPSEEYGLWINPDLEIL